MGGGGMLGAVGDPRRAVRPRTHRPGPVRGRLDDGRRVLVAVHPHGRVPGSRRRARAGAMHLSGAHACYRIYRAGDGKYLTVGALEPQFWRALCEALGAARADPPAVRPPRARRRGRGAAPGHLRDAQPRDEWVASSLEGLEACVGPVNDFAEAVRDPQVRAPGSSSPRSTGRRSGPGPAVKFDPPAERALRPAPGDRVPTPRPCWPRSAWTGTSWPGLRERGSLKRSCQRGSLPWYPAMKEASPMVIDCNDCTMQHTSQCEDCVVTYILRGPGEPLVVDGERRRPSTSWAGRPPLLRLVPRLRPDWCPKPPGRPPGGLAAPRTDKNVSRRISWGSLLPGSGAPQFARVPVHSPG